jgi:hypothetical protein
MSSEREKRTYLNEIHLLKLRQTRWSQNIEDADDVLVIKMSKELYLAQCPQAEHGVVKGRDALDSDFALRWDVHGRAGERVRMRMENEEE